ncbi:homeobox-leucine zipper protein HAT4-like isoform X1 [Asparagus officinalis]|uniref:homeobox-leucine zipper protein HAT4-like isoform X1 n=1 Tax=Asparagus officinalis TaxID=4686 RepID=UPI00098DF4B0|nr:homeobox-leucine zipper protein HAT4-like isoform X1 [Asparagus officinalis]
MAAESEDLRLSLSLSSSQSFFPLKLTLFPSSNGPSKARFVNGEVEEDAGAWSPVSTLSSLSGKRSERDDNEGDEDGQNSPKKLRLSKDQTTILEESFKEHNTLNPVSGHCPVNDEHVHPNLIFEFTFETDQVAFFMVDLQKQKQALAKQLNLRPRQVEVWFQNRRARTKLKQTEVECEYLKRWCQKLAEENKRLQKEVGELRALKSVSPRLQTNAAPPTTLSMCPSCESTTPSAPALNPWSSYFFTGAS